MKTALRTSLLVFLAAVLALTLAGCKAQASPGTMYEVISVFSPGCFFNRLNKE